MRLWEAWYRPRSRPPAGRGTLVVAEVAVGVESASASAAPEACSWRWGRTGAGRGLPSFPPVLRRASGSVAPPVVGVQVQVRGSVVYANHSVSVEVRARAPVSVISEGTHLLVARRPSATVVLHGSLSYDPDRPGAALR